MGQKQNGMNRMNVAKMVAAVLILGIMFGCSSPQSRLPGRWVEEGNNDTQNYIEFFSDNTVTIKTPEMPMSGKWTILSDSRIKADMDIMFSKLTVMFEFKGRRLIMDIMDTDGKKATFVKM